MEKSFAELIKNIKTTEELSLVLDEITKKRLKGKKIPSDLEKKLRALPKLRLEIAFSPPESFIKRVSQWLEKELGQKIILDVVVNPKIIGGAVIEFQGKWRDFSLAKEIHHLLSDYPAE